MSKPPAVPLVIPSRLGDYDVQFQPDGAFFEALLALPKRIFVLDATVWELYRTTLLNGIPASDAVILPIHEERKNLDSVRLLYDRLLASPAKRNLTMVAVGGGILQDVAGYAASTLYRGIPWILVPTTLLAQADSCIGGKTSLNYGDYKNLLGTFYPPRTIHIHTPFLKTQLDADFFSGLGEVVKLHLLGAEHDPTLVSEALPALLPRMVRREPEALLEGVRRSLGIKRDFIAEDEFDRGRRNLLNYGHCFGHALESASSFRIPHGQGVVVGMLAANLAARNRGWLSPTVEKEFRDRFLRPCLTIAPTPQELQDEPILEAMKKDKKRTGEGLPLILFRDGLRFERIGDLSFQEAAIVLQELRETFTP